MCAIEFCVTDIQGVLLAAKYGATRVELCVDLNIGGLTPSFGLIEASADLMETHVLIRPRGGNFVYNETELAIIRADILQAHLAGATGVVFGCLDEKNELHQTANETILALAEQLDLQPTFHRAFDFVKDPKTALDTLVDWEVKRVLTAGQGHTALEGAPLLSELVEAANGKIEIMAGGGVNPINASALLATNVDALHCSIHKSIDFSSNMGAQLEYDLEKIEGMISFKNS